jgi:hypothetical protein
MLRLQPLSARAVSCNHSVATAWHPGDIECGAPAQIILYNDAAATARNIMSHEELFRLGVAGNEASRMTRPTGGGLRM